MSSKYIQIRSETKMEKYEELEMSVIVFESEDIITDSINFPPVT